MDIVNKLKKELLKQAFTEEQKQTERLNECKHIASIYAQTENAIAVLSDMKANISYIYYGGVAEKLGLAERNTAKTIQSIWEEEIFSHDSHRGLSDCPGHTIEQSQSLPDQKIVWTIFRPACPG